MYDIRTDWTGANLAGTCIFWSYWRVVLIVTYCCQKSNNKTQNVESTKWYVWIPYGLHREIQPSETFSYNGQLILSHPYTLSRSISTPYAPTLNTNPSPSPPRAPAPIFQHSNRPRLATSHLCPFSASACKISISRANLSTSSLLTANLVTLTPLGQEIGSAGRKAVDRMEGAVKIVLQESRVTSCVVSVVSDFELIERGFVTIAFEGEVEECKARKDQLNVSISSRIREWMRRCVLLWQVVSKR